MKTPRAAALAYDSQTDAAPKVIASGVGEIAKTIIKKAKELNVPIFANPILAESLTRIPIDESIPEELYASVVEIFIWLKDVESSCQLSKSLEN
ncbi:EscU/YscU/HrcU family type III secretion system export apparatus switch protein [Helicobacter sp. 11S02596-1]|uniref:EscU/YscU/HrcU family type III secretion system export apparatus switch protein n=1 Tax=Helicobacter sp. 11S02596-1 TaxID=1476194 RepID=UPI000BA72BD3|nr:EscU/YscU/HrcU family type III secretion system export apparatus switch protein [Helicobacter sp. 11S02596-1]PAF42787.1 flagellar biosynthesis protein FlhB [Helicobacter sp. 11S02596-1]